MKLKLEKQQKRQLENLWFIYGNGGKFSTLSNHKFLQQLLERGDDLRKFYSPSCELLEKVDSILAQVSDESESV